VYSSDFINRAGEWKPVRGEWKVKDSAFAQTAQGAQRFAWLPGHNFDTYTLKLKARKTSRATNAFIIAFGVKDEQTMMRAHIGSYVNVNSVFESVTNGMNVSDLTNQKRLPAPIETGRWYDITLEVGRDRVDCFLDSTLLMTYTEPQKLFSIAGRDQKTGQLIIKLVNASDRPYQTTLNIDGAQPGGSATLFTLTADGPTSENSMEEPVKYITRQAAVPGFSSQYVMEVQPFSISVLRVNDSAWNKAEAKK
jgi:alpha-L-arabinofuranosidase